MNIRESIFGLSLCPKENLMLLSEPEKREALAGQPFPVLPVEACFRDYLSSDAHAASTISFPF